MAGFLISLFRDVFLASWMTMVFTTVGLVGFVFSFAKRRRNGWPLSPWCLPLIGNLHQLTSLPHKGLHYLSQKYGPLMLVYLGSMPHFVISNSDLAKEVTQTHDYTLSNRAKTNASRLLFSGSDDLVFSSNSHFWRQARKLCVNELLSVKQVQSFHYVIEEEVAELVETIRIKCQHGQSAINFSSSFLTLSNNIIARVVIGRKCIEEGSDDETMIQLVKRETELLGNFSLGDFIPFLSGLDNLTGFNRKGVQTSQALHTFMDQVIDEHETQSACQTEYDRSDRKDFVQIINELQEANSSSLNFTRDNIKAILLDMFLGGTDTSAAIMEWTMAELAKHPKIMKKAQDEIRDIVGQQPKISKCDMNRMEYLHCVVKESLRLHSPFILGREASTSVTIGGFKLPKKSSVLINSWAIHRDPYSWDKPLDFLPERFLNRTFDYKAQDHKYIPFGAGRRSCPGADFAVTEVEYALANMLFWFNWELPDGMSDKDLDMSETGANVSRKKVPLILMPVPKIS